MEATPELLLNGKPKSGIRFVGPLIELRYVEDNYRWKNVCRPASVYEISDSKY